MRISANGYPLREGATLREKMKKLWGNLKFSIAWSFWSFTHRHGMSMSPAYHLMMKPLMRKHGFKVVGKEVPRKTDAGDWFEKSES